MNNSLLATNRRGQSSRIRFESDTLAPFQYFNVFRQKPHLLPEEKLMLTVLTDAIECLEKNRDATNRRGRAVYQRTRDWVVSEDGGGLFSFKSICDTLDINSNYVRQGLAPWLDAARKRPRRQTTKGNARRYQYRVRHSQISCLPAR